MTHLHILPIVIFCNICMFTAYQVFRIVGMKVDRVISKLELLLVLMTSLNNDIFCSLDKSKNTKPTVVQLAKGEVEEVTIKGHERCLKLTSTQQGDRSVYLSFDSDGDYSKWLRKTKKVSRVGVRILDSLMQCPPPPHLKVQMLHMYMDLKKKYC